MPNPGEQANVISETLDKAGIDADSISYIEAHGTGTSLGDPIEISGLTKALHSMPGGHALKYNLCCLHQPPPYQEFH